MFVEKQLLDFIKKVDANFALGEWFWLGCYRELVPHFSRFYTLSRNSNVVVSAGPV
jgi:hypothetical protein